MILGIPRVKPMLATVAKEPFDDDAWTFEIKLDGYRCLAYVTKDECYLDSRNGKPLLPRFPRLSAMSAGLRASSALLDGEIVAVKDGKVDFSYLRTEPAAVSFVAFDLLHLDGRDLLTTPLKRRVALLRDVYSWDHLVTLSQSTVGQGKALFGFAKDRDLEGIIAKDLDSLYFPGARTKDWLKIKNTKEDCFLVVGFLPSSGRRLGSLLIAKENDGYLEVVGRVGSGLNHQHEKALLRVLRAVDAPAQTIAASAGLTRSESRCCQWVEPFYGVEVSYTEITPDGRLRHPVFRGLVSKNTIARRFLP
jgi:DNA ligase D-like protein (predicted ligase)